MAIKIPRGLPATRTLRSEGVELIGEDEADVPGFRPVRVALLNLMPNKAETETQLARLLGATPLPVELVLLTTSSYRPTHVPSAHLEAFYQTWEDVREEHFDGLIVTGAPVEMMPFSAVEYWNELCAIFDWSLTHAHTRFLICWGAQAGLNHFHGVPKHCLHRKRFGIFEHRVAVRTPLLEGLDDHFPVPVSRHTEVRSADLPANSGPEVLLASDVAGLCLLLDEGPRTVYMFNHLEYDTGTLAEEYRRDLGKRADVLFPHAYFPGDDPLRSPRNTWRGSAKLLFGNWIREFCRPSPGNLTGRATS